MTRRLLSCCALSVALLGATGQQQPASAATAVVLPVQPCTVTNAGSDAVPTTAVTLRVGVPAAFAGQVGAYGGGGLVAPGPKGWACAVLLAGDGSRELALRPARNAVKSKGGIVLTVVPRCVGCVASLVCPFFDARAILVLPCPAAAPAGERRVRLRQNLIGYYDPPRLKGYGRFSGLGNASYGRVLFEPDPPFAMAAECTLPARLTALCPAIVATLLEG